MIINHSTHLYLKFETSWLLSSKLAADSLKFLHNLNKKKGPKISHEKKITQQWLNFPFQHTKLETTIEGTKVQL